MKKPLIQKTSEVTIRVFSSETPKVEMTADFDNALILVDESLSVFQIAELVEALGDFLKGEGIEPLQWTIKRTRGARLGLSKTVKMSPLTIK